MPVQRISDVISHQLYGTIFFNYIAGQATSVDEQTDAIVEVIFNGILTVEERHARRALQACATGEPGGAPACLGNAGSAAKQENIQQGDLP
jgi:hypothetical protein